MLMVALGEKTLERAGQVVDAVVLHTFFSDEATANSVAAVRRGAEQAGRDPASVRVWSVLATVGDHLDHDLRMKKLIGRLSTYLQGYGDVLVRTNGWDPDVLTGSGPTRSCTSVPGAIDALATTEQLEYLATILPDEWTASAATGTPEQCAATVAAQFDLGVDSVIMHESDARRARPGGRGVPGGPAGLARRPARQPGLDGVTGTPDGPGVIDRPDLLTADWVAAALAAAGTPVELVGHRRGARSAPGRWA